MNKNCVLCLCVYNNEFGLNYCFKNIKKIKTLFKKFNILVFYDHSKDKSLELLYNFKHESKINMTIIINKKKKSTIRTENIAYARNFLLKIIRKKYKKYDLFMFMDTNEYACIGEINIELLKDVIYNKKYEYDSLSFDREAGYYDTWALSFDPYIYSFFHINSCLHYVEKMRNAFSKLLEEYRKKDKLIPVYSAFNGFAIYKTNKFINCEYSSKINLKLFPPNTIQKQIKNTNCKLINYFKNDCEHRAFHLKAIKKNNAKIRICPKSLFKKLEKLPKKLRGPA